VACAERIGYAAIFLFRLLSFAPFFSTRARQLALPFAGSVAGLELGIIIAARVCVCVLLSGSDLKRN
jgi:hypothetical protein